MKKFGEITSSEKLSSLAKSEGASLVIARDNPSTPSLELLESLDQNFSHWSTILHQCFLTPLIVVLIMVLVLARVFFLVGVALLLGLLMLSRLANSQWTLCDEISKLYTLKAYFVEYWFIWIIREPIFFLVEVQVSFVHILVESLCKENHLWIFIILVLFKFLGLGPSLFIGGYFILQRKVLIEEVCGCNTIFHFLGIFFIAP